MHRRSLFLLLAAGSLTACEPRATGTPRPSPSGAWSSAAPHAAVAADYRWFAAERDFGKGFCFTWIKDLTPQQVLQRLGATELERVSWQQVVGSGDGERGGDRYFFGVARVDDWSLMVEDNGTLGTVDERMAPLSRGGTVISHYRGGDGHGRLLLIADGVTGLDFDPLAADRLRGSRAMELRPVIDGAGFAYARRLRLAGDAAGYRAHCTQAAFALTERLTGVPMTRELLDTKTYLLSTVPRST